MYKRQFQWSNIGGAFTAGCVALSLNAGAYMAEIIRGGIEAVDKGQMEAARSLGLSYGKAMRKVIPVSYTHLDVYKRQGLCWPT